MSTGLYSHTTRGTGTVLTAAIYNSDHQNHITNQNPSMTGAYSDNLTQMRTVTDPGAVGTETLASSLSGELERLRFAIRRIVDKAQWYEAPDANLGDLGAALAGVFAELTVTADLTPTIITSNQNDYAPTGHADAFCFRLSSDAVRSITGLAGGSAGRIVILSNVGSFDIDLIHESASSTAANRFAMGVGVNCVLQIGETLLLRYDATASRWRPIATAEPSTGLLTLLSVLGHIDMPEVTPPANPAANVGRLYARDLGGVTRLAYRDSAGLENILIGGGSVDVQTFNSSGTWNKPAVGTIARIQVWGPGGGGGAGANPDCGGGGGGGAYNERIMPLSSLGSSETVTVGTGGAGSAGVSDGAAGSGPSSFGAHLSAFQGGGGAGSSATDEGGGGGGGQLAAGATATGAAGAVGGSPGSAAGGGGTGGTAPTAPGAGSTWGGGGGGAGGAGDGGDGGASQYGGGGGGGSGGTGTGGVSVYGGGGGAGGNASGNPGTNGTAPAGGGGGSISAQAGNGANGRVIVTVW